MHPLVRVLSLHSACSIESATVPHQCHTVPNRPQYRSGGRAVKPNRPLSSTTRLYNSAVLIEARASATNFSVLLPILTSIYRGSLSRSYVCTVYQLQHIGPGRTAVLSFLASGSFIFDNVYHRLAKSDTISGNFDQWILLFLHRRRTSS